MKEIKYYFLLVLARLISFLIRILNVSSGTSFVGFFVLKLDKNFIKNSSKYIKNDIITVTGTNGKTTTSGVLAHILDENKKKVLSNSKGANMISGIANTFAVNINPFKKFDYAVIETDEAYLTKLYDSVNSDYLLVTNLFQDQLDRYGEISFTAQKIQSAINKNPNLKLVLNADDPLVRNLKPINDENAIYYGINKIEYESGGYIVSKKEIINCPLCDETLNYSKIFYSHQGHYNCSCGYSRPKCKYSADIMVHSDFYTIKFYFENEVYEYTTHLIGLYNVYNVFAAIVMCFELGIKDVQSAIDSYHPEFGRSEIRNINGKNAIIQLIKNPTGANEVLKTVNKNSNILIAINDNYADGRDMSWLWDTDFEILKGCSNPIITSGNRAYDIATRLKYAGIENIKVITNIDDAIKKVTQNDNVTILPSYTVLLHINKSKY